MRGIIKLVCKCLFKKVYNFKLGKDLGLQVSIISFDSNAKKLNNCSEGFFGTTFESCLVMLQLLFQRDNPRLNL